MEPPRPSPTPSATSAGRSRPPRSRRAARGDSPYRSRFGLVLGALIGVAIATLAIGAAVYVGTDANNGAPKGWSAWKPDTDDGVKASPRDRHPRRPQVPARRRQPDRRRAGRAARGLRRPARGRAAHRAAGRRHRLHQRQGPDVHAQRARAEGLGPRRQAVGGSATCCCAARRSSSRSTRSATSRTSTSWSPCCRPSRRTKNKDGTTTTSTEDSPTQALFFRPGDLEPQLEIPLRATIPARRRGRTRSRPPSRAASTR